MSKHSSFASSETIARGVNGSAYLRSKLVCQENFLEIIGIEHDDHCVFMSNPERSGAEVALRGGGLILVPTTNHVTLIR